MIVIIILKKNYLNNFDNKKIHNNKIIDIDENKHAFFITKLKESKL